MSQAKNNDAHPYAPKDDAPAQGQQQAAPEQGQAQQTPKQLTIDQMKKGCCEKLTKLFTSPLMNERLMKMAGGDASRVAKNLTQFLSQITQDDGGTRHDKYLCWCTIASLTTCFLESMNMQLPFDSRKLVCMVIYDGANGLEAELDISYKGFINSLCKHYSNAHVDAKIIMEGDEFDCEESAEKVVFRHKPADAFAKVDKMMAGVRGAYCYFTYTHANGQKVERMVRISKDDLWLIRSKAKTKNVWDEFTSEQILKSIIRRAAKIPFAAIDLDMDIEEVDNRHFILDKPEGENRLKLLMAAQEEVVNGGNNPPKDGTVGSAPAGTSADGSGTATVQGETAKPGVSEAVAPKAENAVNPEQGAQGKPPGLAQGIQEAEDMEGHQPAAISDADFEDTTANSPSNDAGKQEVLPPGGVPAEMSTYEVSQRQLEAARGEVWDGKTLYTGDGKKHVAEFTSAQVALLYVKRVIGNRKHKASRLDIIKNNQPLINALIKAGAGAAVDELHKLADQGE